MRKWQNAVAIAALIGPLAAPLSASAADGGQRVTIHFKSTASHILQALAHKAKANIVVPDDITTVVTADLDNVPIEDALRIVAAQAGVVFRKSGNTFVVAKPEAMAKILEQVGTQEMVPLRYVDPASVMPSLHEALPFVTLSGVGKDLLIKGASEDIDSAKVLLQTLDVAGPGGVIAAAPLTESLKLITVHAPDVLAVLKNFKVAAQQVGDDTVVVTGTSAEVRRSLDFIKGLDSGMDNNVRYVVYQVRYHSARALSNTLLNLVSGLVAVVGPEPYRIPRSRLNIASAGTLSTGTGGGGAINTNSGSSDTSDTGGLGGGGAAAGTLGTSGSSVSDSRARTLILGGREDRVQLALKTLSQIDVAPPQIALDVKVVSTSPQTTSALGIAWSQSIGTSVFERPSTAPGAAGNDFPTANGGAQPWIKAGGFGLGNFGRLPIQVSATLNAFFQRDDVKVLAKPTITALNDEEGMIFVGETRRISVSSVVPNSGANNIVLNNVVEIPVGIILQMRPHLTENDMIQLRVHPIYSSGSAVNPNTGLFDTFTRETETTVRLKSDETIVIGGLLQDEDSRTMTKVPILGDVPLIGQFFRNHTTTHLRREVLVFVTPHLIKD